MKNKINILIIEDNPDDSELVNIFLKNVFRDKYSLTVAERLLKGLDLLASNKYDIVLLDLSLPDSHGIETFSRIFAAFPNIPIVVLTGYSDETIGIDAVKLGAQDFLDKNELDCNILKKAISYSIERHKLAKALTGRTKKLVLSEKRLRESQELAHIGNWDWNISENTILWSDELYRIFGFAPNELKVSYEKFVGFIHPQDREFVNSQIEDAFQSLQPFKFYHRIILRDETVKTLYATGEVITDENNIPVRLLGTGQDVTDRLQVEQKFHKLLESAPDGVVTIDDKGIVSDWNNKAETIFGWKREEILGLNLFETIIPERHKLAHEQGMARILIKDKEEGINRQFEMVAMGKNGKEFPVELTVSVIKQENKNLFIGFFRDITERKLAQNLLKEKETLYRTVVESLSEGLVITDIDDKIIFVNSEMEKLTGYSSGEMIGSVAFKLLLSEDQHQEMDNRMIRRLSGILESYVLKITRKDSSYFLANINSAPYRNGNGEIVGTVGAITDVTASKHEEELEKLVLAATQSHNSVVIADKDGRIEWVNEGFTKLSGYVLNELKGTCGEILREGQKPLFNKSSFDESAIKNQETFVYENKNYTKDGREYWVITTITPVLNEKGEVERLIGIDSDITNRKRMEEELIVANRIAEHSLNKGNKALDDLMKAKKQLEESVKMREEFLANMSHEIRTPMNGIIGLTDVLLKTKLDDEQQEYLGAIKSSGNTLMIVINDILDLSKMDAGKMIFEEIPFKIATVFNSVIDLFHPKADEKNLELNMRLDDKIPEILLGDSSRLCQVLMNLVSNAVKFTEKGQVLLTGSLVDEDEDLVQIQFSIKDTGIGIPGDKINSLFHDFTQAGPEINRKFGGTGLGLAISRKLVELQGGNIKVNSEVMNGTTFTISLGFKKCKNNIDLPDQLNKDNFMDRKLENINVLLVEDNPINQLLADKILKDWGCAVTTADNGRIAIEKLKNASFDIVLMDVKMPELDGYETTNYIRKNMSLPVRDIPIIALTAHAATWEAEKCIKAGMNDYISKPFKVAELYNKLAKYSNGNKDEVQTMEYNNNNKPPQLTSSSKNINLDYLRTIARGNNEFILKMIKTFIKQSVSGTACMQQQLSDKDWEALFATAHKMKPSFVFMGIKKLEKTISSIEKNAREKTNLETLPQLISEVVTVCDDSVEELRKELELLSK